MGGEPGSTGAELGGMGGMGMIDTNPNGDAGAPDGWCAADLYKAEVVPLDDVYDVCECH